MILPSIETPADLQNLSYEELDELSEEIRQFIIETVTNNPTGGHLGSNLGVVELTLALHRVFESPKDIILWDTGHQAYVHKLLTGRRYGFKNLRQRGGLSGYPNRSESQHDWIESSHASTALSYAHGLSVALEQRKELIGHGGKRHVVAVVGDGSLTGGMAYEALNNLGHSNQRVVIVLNDNGRSYAPTISKLSESLTVAATQQDVPHVARSSAPHGPPPAQGRQGRLPRHRRAYVGRARDGHAAHVLREPRRALHRSDRRARHRVDGEHAEERGAVGRADPRARPHDQGPRLRTRHRRRHEDARLQAAAASRRRRGRAAVVLPSLLRLTGRPRERRRTRRGDHRGDGRSDGSAQLPGPVPRPLPRRRHRRATRRDRRGRHGHGRAEARRRGLLHVLLSGLRPGPPRRRPLEPARSSSSSTAPASPATTVRATTDSSTSPCAWRSRT